MLHSSTHLILWLTLALVPLACDSDNNNPDGGDSVNNDGVPSQYQLVAVEDLIAGAATWDGEPVTFEGYVILGNTSCTEMGCTMEDPCCNTCNANYKVAASAEIINIVGGGIPQVGCIGTDCAPTETCAPFPVVPAYYTLWGTLEADAGPTTLYLDGWSPVQQ